MITIMIFSRDNVKHLWKTFVWLFLMLIIIVNWSHVSRVLYYFDWKVVRAITSDLMPDFVNANYFDYFGAMEGTLKIPKIGIKAPIIFVDGEIDFNKVLKQGVLHYPNSALPGEQGTAIILGHSSPLNWPKINYDRVFNDLDKLAKGDKLIVFYQGNEYVYMVDSQNIFSKQQTKQFLNYLNRISVVDNSDGVLVLSTCWPPGKDQNRLIVSATLKSPR